MTMKAVHSFRCTAFFIQSLIFSYVGGMCMSLTHYAAGPSPVIFNTGYVPQNVWWKLGFFSSVINLIIFVGLGSIWMKAIGMW